MMRTSYLTVSHKAHIEIEEKRSTFIGFCQPLADEQEAIEFVSGIRARYPDATHHVYAWLLGGERQLQRYSDDGEPQGTAGIPVLDVLRKGGIENAGLVVVRYFGGVLLGAGGLVRAYSKAATQALEAAKPIQMQLSCRYRIVVPYTDYDRLRFHLEQEGFWLGEEEFAMDVELTVGAEPARAARLIEICTDQTAGSALIEEAGSTYIPLPPPDPPPQV
ncbi:MAG: YigZ family protein [Clostridiaceae bacterium]|nr:YigZ family protein [Clostridiaceae bacterium]